MKFFIVGLFAMIPACLLAETCTTSLLEFETYESPWPSRGSGLVPFGFTRDFDFTIKVIADSGTLRTVTQNVAGLGWFSGFGYFCSNQYGQANPKFNGYDPRVSGNFWEWQVKVDQEIQGGSKIGSPWGCAGSWSTRLPSPALQLQYGVTCSCNPPAGCTGSCLPKCDGTCQCTPIAIKFGATYEFYALANGPLFRNLPTDPPRQMTWPTGRTGWLVHPTNGAVNSIEGELFDYPRLSAHDLNHNHRIDAGDGPFYSELRIWFDRNGDGIAQADELFTLRSLGIDDNGISLDTHSINWDNGQGTTVWLVSPVDSSSKSCQAGDALISVRP